MKTIQGAAGLATGVTCRQGSASGGRLRRFFAAALLGVSALPAAAQIPTCDAPGFIAPDAYSAPFLGGLVTAEVTSDPYADLVGASENGLVVLPGLPDGSFGPAISSAFGGSPGQFALGDFSGDGVLDVVLTYTFGGVQVALGNGDGTFQTPQSIGFGGGFLAAADLDGNDLADVLVSSGNLISVYLSQGGGVFSDPVATPLWASAPIVLGDVDGDDLLDLVGPRPPAGGLGGEIVYYPGRGDGAFDPSIKISDGESTSIAVADFTGDGSLDVAAVRGFRVGVSVGHGNGTFDAEVFTDTPVPREIRPADLNGDGFLDLLVKMTDEFQQTQGPLRVLIGNGDGTFLPDLRYAIGSSFYYVAAADFGTPDHVDVAVTGFETGTVNVFRGNGDGTLRGPTEIGSTFNSNIQSIVSGDFNEDGYADVAYVFSFGSSIMSFQFGGPLGRFTGGGTLSPGGTLAGLVTADFNGDGHLDLATLSIAGGTLAVFLGHGDGTFSIVSNTPTPVSFYSILLAADLDGDGAMDVVTLNRDPNATADPIDILMGHGDATFEPRPSIDLGLPPVGMTAADLDSDGLLDLAVTGALPGNSYPGTLFVLGGLGDGLFGAPTQYATGIAPGPVRAADLVGGPALDLAVGHGSDAPLFIYPGNGDGTFGEPAGIGTGSGIGELVIGDFRGHGNADILALGDRIHLLYGEGDGVFTLPLSYTVGASVNALVADDFDGNGTLDAITTHSGAFLGGIDLLRNATLAVRVRAPGAANPGETTRLFASGSGLGLVSYQWRKGGVDLSDGETISGSTTATLTIDPVSFDDAGSYDVVVTDSCGSVTSNSATLAVEFADVPTSSPFHDDILTIATEGITGGCGGGNYCPSSPVRRDQMAVFLLKAEHGSGYIPPACAGVFPDVPCPGSFTDWIEQLATEGVTGGCGGGNYCPSQSVTRAQMAIFLLKTREGSSYAPPAATGIFGDVPVGSFGADFIEELYHLGITGGCSTSRLLYCPPTAVLRQQMATFLVRTFFP